MRLHMCLAKRKAAFQVRPVGSIIPNGCGDCEVVKRYGVVLIMYHKC